MMAYDNQFVLCVMHEGAPVREINGSATIPHHSEYKIRLKNKHSNLRAKARVWIDGRKVSGLGDFILQPGQTMDLERFLDSSLDSGNRFKFVPLSDSRVNDPTDSNNGIVKVEFYRESSSFTIYDVTPIDPFKSLDDCRWSYTHGPNTTGTLLGQSSGFAPNTSSSTYSIKSSGTSVTNDSCFVSNGTAGATVEGGFSNQKFSYGEHFNVETYPITLTVILKAPDTFNFVKPEIDVYHGPKPPKRRVHCTNCGERRHRRSDKFCGKCGTRFNKRMRRA